MTAPASGIDLVRGSVGAAGAVHSAAAILRPLEVPILSGVGHRQEHLLQRLRRPLRAERLPQDLLGEAHRERILPIDRAIAEEWGRMNVPHPLPVVDGLLAATAKVSGLTFATRNTADVENAGVELLDPFSLPR